MKKGIMIGLSVAIFCVAMFIIGNTVLTFVGDKDSVEMDVTKFKLGNEVYWMNEGDTLSVDAWNEEIETEYNDEDMNGKPVLFNGIGIGSTVDEVIEKFNIKSGYANLNMEVSTEEHDGTTDVVHVLYKNKNSFADDFLDTMIEFGYKKTGDTWKMVKYSDIDKADILYIIDINGFPEDELVNKNEVIMIHVEYLNENK